MASSSAASAAGAVVVAAADVAVADVAAVAAINAAAAVDRKWWQWRRLRKRQRTSVAIYLFTHSLSLDFFSHFSFFISVIFLTYKRAWPLPKLKDLFTGRFEEGASVSADCKEEMDIVPYILVSPFWKWKWPWQRKERVTLNNTAQKRTKIARSR